MLFRLPPPLLFAAAFGLGALLQRVVPLPALPPDRRVHAAGIAIVAIGIALALSLLGAFLRRGTTLNPFGAPTRLITGGAYRISRNPMYLSLVLVYLGATVLYGAIWPLLLLAAPLAVLTRFVIPQEEARLHHAFGAAYAAYCTRVRRWL